MMKTYYTRNFPLHKVVIDSEGNKLTQTYMPFNKVELTDEEAIRYQHLIETEAQYNSRQPKTSKKTDVK